MKKFVQRSLLAIVFACLFMGAAYAQGGSKVLLYVHDPARTANPATGEHPEMLFINPIREAFPDYQVILFRTVQLELATPEQLDSLRAADLIIIGRAIGSWNWTAAGREIWNTIETPVLSLNPWAVRTAQLNWFFASTVFGGAAGVDVMATVNYPQDPIFAGIVMDEQSQFALWNEGYGCIALDPAFLGNGQIMLQLPPTATEVRVFFVRFAPGVAFYEGSEIPAGPRTLFGMGIDGDNNFRYFNYTEEGRTVFLREVERLANLKGVGTNVGPHERLLDVMVYPNPTTSHLNVKMSNLKKVEVWDVTGKLMYSFDGNGFEVIADISSLKRGLYFVRAIDTDNNIAVRRVVKY